MTVKITIVVGLLNLNNHLTKIPSTPARVLLVGTLYLLTLQVLNLSLNLSMMFSNVFQVNMYKSVVVD